MSKTIAQFVFGLQLAGMQRVVVDLAKSFRNKGYNSLVCTTMFGGELVSELRESGISFKCLGLKKSYDPQALHSVMRYIKDNGIDVVITHGKSGCLLPRIAAIMARVPVFIHVEHSVSEEKKFYHIFAGKILSLFTDKIVCVSEDARQSLIKIEKTNADKVTVIHNGMDTSRFQYIKEIDTKKTKTRKIVGIVARFDAVKGHIYFVQAAAKIVQSYKNVEFIFVGDGSLRTMIEQKVKDYQIESYCRFLGNRDDAINLLCSFDVFVLSSLSEGLPVSLLEAQYLGIATVATQVGGIPEMIKNGFNGLLVPAKDPDMLASAVLRILTDEKLGQEMGFHAKEVYRQNYSGEKMTNAYLELISACE